MSLFTRHKSNAFAHGEIALMVLVDQVANLERDEDLMTTTIELNVVGEFWETTRDDEGRIVSETNLDGDTWHFVYDGEALVGEVTPSGTTFLYDHTGAMIAMVEGSEITLV